MTKLWIDAVMHPALLYLEQRFQPSILTTVDDPLLAGYQICLSLKRDDLLHPVISGNKWRKLKYILNHALLLNDHTLISMGSVYSNHLHALAYLGQELGLKTVGLIRGEPPIPLTPTLQDACAWGMTLKFVSRSNYRQLRQYPNCDELPDLPTGSYWLPEGGSQVLALQGVAELVAEITEAYDWLCVPCGTGATLAGLVNAVPQNSRVLGFAALKNAAFLNHDVAQLSPQSSDNWQINQDYHFGGFAKTTAELMEFIDAFQNRTGIILEPVYTGKMLFGLYDLITKNTFNPGTRLIAVHTGGLQGNRGFRPCTDN